MNRRKHERTIITIPPSELPQIVEVIVVNDPHKGTARLGFIAERHIQIVRDDAIVAEPDELLGKEPQS